MDIVRAAVVFKVVGLGCSDDILPDPLLESDPSTYNNTALPLTLRYHVYVTIILLYYYCIMLLCIIHRYIN